MMTLCVISSNKLNAEDATAFMQRSKDAIETRGWGLLPFSLI
jgi:hypothetical protein